MEHPRKLGRNARWEKKGAVRIGAVGSAKYNGRSSLPEAYSRVKCDSASVRDS